MKKILKEFSLFIQQGNIVEISTSFLLAAAFREVVTSFSDGIIMPIINKILGSKNAFEGSLNIVGINFQYGSFISALLQFVIIGFVLFIIVKAYNKFKIENKDEVEEVSNEEVLLLRDIKELLQAQNKNNQ